MNPTLRFPLRGALLAAVFAFVSGATAQTAAPTEPAKSDNDNQEKQDILKLDSFVVTAVAEPGTVSKMKSSISVSSVSFDTATITVPRFTAEIFRNLPALRSEATAGEANTNITARGLPLSTGGSQYVQLQEDGVPVLQFGDIAFATADTFLRADRSISTIEFVRGGSASTYATSAPGGVINLISKTGDVAGGSLGFTRGLDFDTNRVDLDYGSPITKDLSFHLGGFYRTGEGSRRTGFSGFNGGQLKFNITRKFEEGYVRLFAKFLDDAGPTYMPMPTRVTGSNGAPSYSSFANYDILRDTQYTPYLTRDITLDANGNRVNSDVTQGVRARSVALGAELNFNLPGGWNLSDRLSFASNSGRFIAPFPAEVTAAPTLANAIGGPGATLWYATGPKAGQQITSPAALNGNGLLTRMHLFNTALNDMGNASNNLKVSKSFPVGDGAKINIGFGDYLSRQNINQDWNWNSYLLEVGRAANLIDVKNAAGTLVTERGQLAYGVPAWGWFARKYDLKYDINAPFASLGYVSRAWSFDVSARRESGKVRGAKYDSTPTRAVLDMNGDGAISYVESLGVQAININTPSPIVRYGYNYTSYSAGGNYSFNKDVSAFARYSKGYTVRADRLLDAGNVRPDGSIPTNDVAFNTAKQAELGLKYRSSKLVPGVVALNVTLFNAKTDEANSEAAKGGPPLILRKYEATGIELEGAYAYGGFDLRASATWTDAEIKGANDPSVIGHKPRRQADFIFTVSPTYTIGRLVAGASLIGTTKSYAQDNNELVMPGYVYVNAFVTVKIVQGLTLNLSVNNFFNKVGLTEEEEGSLPVNGIVRARGIPGRTTSLALNYTF